MKNIDRSFKSINLEVSNDNNAIDKISNSDQALNELRKLRERILKSNSLEASECFIDELHHLRLKADQMINIVEFIKSSQEIIDDLYCYTNNEHKSEKNDKCEEFLDKLIKFWLSNIISIASDVKNLYKFSNLCIYIIGIIEYSSIIFLIKGNRQIEITITQLLNDLQKSFEPILRNKRLEFPHFLGVSNRVIFRAYRLWEYNQENLNLYAPELCKNIKKFVFNVFHLYLLIKSKLNLKSKEERFRKE